MNEYLKRIRSTVSKVTLTLKNGSWLIEVRRKSGIKYEKLNPKVF